MTNLNCDYIFDNNKVYFRNNFKVDADGHKIIGKTSSGIKYYNKCTVFFLKLFCCCNKIERVEGKNGECIYLSRASLTTWRANHAADNDLSATAAIESVCKVRDERQLKKQNKADPNKAKKPEPKKPVVELKESDVPAMMLTAAKELLVKQLKLSITAPFSEFTVASIRQIDWSSSALGDTSYTEPDPKAKYKPTEMVKTPGYKIVIRYNDVDHVIHTDMGSGVKYTGKITPPKADK